jgi:hypothetical protein
LRIGQATETVLTPKTENKSVDVMFQNHFNFSEDMAAADVDTPLLVVDTAALEETRNAKL